MHGTGTRLRLSIALTLGLSLVGAGPVLPVAAAPRDAERITIEHFMTGLACIESSGRFSVVNARSGAYGKYQIMPRNWPVWAGRFLGDRRARPTPYHQEVVARGRVQRLYDVRGTWRRVAYWWLTGNSDADESRWSRKAAGYVTAVMRIARQAASPRTARRLPQRCRPATFDAPLALPSRLVTVTGGSVNVRRKAGYEHRLVAVVRRGDVVPVLGRDRDPRGRAWLKIALDNGDIGWIARWYTAPPR